MQKQNSKAESSVNSVRSESFKPLQTRFQLRIGDRALSAECISTAVSKQNWRSLKENKLVPQGLAPQQRTVAFYHACQLFIFRPFSHFNDIFRFQCFRHVIRYKIYITRSPGPCTATVSFHGVWGCI